MKSSLRSRAGGRMWALVLGALLSFTFTDSAVAADPTPDQQYPTPPITPSSGSYLALRQMAQTFTAANSGQLYRIDLFGNPNPVWLPATLTIQVWKTDPDQSSLANVGGPTLSLQRSAAYQVNPWHEFDLATTFRVDMGAQYAIAVYSSPGAWRWSYLNWPVYQGGNLWLRGCTCFSWMATANTSFAFKEYVASTPTNNPPTVTADHPTGMSVTESATPTMTGTYSDPDGDTVSLRADVGQVTPAAGGTWTWTGAQSDEGLHHVVITADDGQGNTATAPFDFTVTDITPTVAITGFYGAVPIVTVAQETLTFEGNWSDLNAPDSHNATWDFGDGSLPITAPVTATTVEASHSFSHPGTYTVRLRVADDDGVAGEKTYNVTVQTTSQALDAISAFVRRLPALSDGQKNSLSVKLDAALDSINRGDAKAANNQLNAFLNELQAYANTGKVSPGDAAALRAAVGSIKASLGSYNRFLEWWPLGL